MFKCNKFFLVLVKLSRILKILPPYSVWREVVHGGDSGGDGIVICVLTDILLARGVLIYLLVCDGLISGE